MSEYREELEAALAKVAALENTLAADRKRLEALVPAAKEAITVLADLDAGDAALDAIRDRLVAALAAKEET